MESAESLRFRLIAMTIYLPGLVIFQQFLEMFVNTKQTRHKNALKLPTEYIRTILLFTAWIDIKPTMAKTNIFKTKHVQIKPKTTQIFWFTNRNCTLNLNCKLLLYKAVLKAIWWYIHIKQNLILPMITAKTTEFRCT